MGKVGKNISGELDRGDLGYLFAILASATLIIGDVYARQPLHPDEAVEWNAGAGVRYQVNPYLALDAGVGRRLTGAPGWYFTFGSAYHVGVRSLMPKLSRR